MIRHTRYLVRAADIPKARAAHPDAEVLRDERNVWKEPKA